MEHFILFKQLLVKEKLVNGPWRLHGPTAIMMKPSQKRFQMDEFD